MLHHLFFWTSHDHKRANTRLWLGLVVLPALVVGIVGCDSGESSTRDATESATAVRVVSVEQRTVHETVDYVGTVRSRETLRVTARVPGTLAEIPVDEGERIESGRLLARIEAPELVAKRERIEAELRRARSEREFLCETYRTDRQLHESDVLPGAKLDESRKRCASGKEGVAAARARLREVETRLKKRRERAPADGIVLEQQAEPGEHVGPGRPLVVLASETREVVVPVTEEDLKRGIEVGTPVRLRVDGRQVVESEVARLDPRAEGPGRTVDGHIPLEGAAADLRIGRSINTSFVTARETEATPVPREALVETEEGRGLFVVHEGTARHKSVEPGIARDNEVTVHPPLEVGQRVVITNLEVLEDGMPVYAVDAEGGTQ